MAKDNPRIYVASLSDYVNGVLHGEWIELGEYVTPDEVWEQVRAMLNASPTMLKYGDPAEEWALHDYEGFGPIKLGEYPNLNDVVELAQAIDGAHDPDAMEAFLHVVDDPFEEIGEFSDRYRGGNDSIEGFVRDWAVEIGDVPDTPICLNYMDWNAYWRGEMDCNGWSVHMVNGTYYFFDERR